MQNCKPLPLLPGILFAMANRNTTAPRGLVEKLASRLRYPQLFLLAATLFVVDLLVPDFIPFTDEILLGLLTVLLGSLRRRKQEPERPPMKDVTPGRR